MIPYFQLTSINLGPVVVQFWGLLVALGIVVALIVSYFEAKKKGLEYKKIIDLAFWVIISALVFARLFHLFYEPGFYFESPLEIFKVWQGGMSIFGGFFGAFLAAIIYLRAKKLSFWKYADVVFFALPLGLFIGRLGCFSIHDHLGKIAADWNPLAIEYLGQVRHENGLYLSINGLVLFLVFLLIRKYKSEKLFVGFYGVMFFIWYGAVRFWLDFYRAEDLPGVSDARYFNLTPAQYLSIVMLVAGIYFLFKLKKKFS